MEKRTYDVVVFGATGFTGKLVAEYLSENYSSEELKWAIAGRDSSKLKSLAEDLSLDSKHIIVADSFDRESLRGMCAQTKVVLTTVGPYLSFGEPLVEACIEEKTNYVDYGGYSI